MEKTNARYLTKEMFTEPITLAVMDVSFISITLILPALKSVLTPNSSLISLVKPQFEAGRSEVGKGGIIKNVAIHKKVLNNIAAFSNTNGWQIAGFTVSPIQGTKGNKEFFVHLQNQAKVNNDLKTIENQIEELVNQA